MQRRRRQLYSRRRQKLRRAGPTDTLFYPLAEREKGRDQRREVERRENGHGVPQREKRIRRWWNHPLDICLRAEHLRELRIFDQAQRHIGARGRDELGHASRRCFGGLIVERRRGRVEGVGREVGTGVDREDEGKGLGEEEGVWSDEQIPERGLDASAESAAAGCVFYDAAIVLVQTLVCS